LVFLVKISLVHSLLQSLSLGITDIQTLQISTLTYPALLQWLFGAGNVAMDCARMLAVDPSELDSTDTADHALAKFHSSNIRKVYIAGRRGVEHAAFTAPELRDLPKLEHTDIHIDATQVSEAHARAEAAGEIEKHLASNLEAWRLSRLNTLKLATIVQWSSASSPLRGRSKATARLKKLYFRINKVEAGKVVDTGRVTSIPCSLVISAIGYRAKPIDGIYFHNGIIENEARRSRTRHQYLHRRLGKAWTVRRDRHK
jgi:ferredoxin--NADP+ reductase